MQPSSELGHPCSTTNDHLDPYSHRFFSDCDDKTYCSAASNGTCLPRQCRRDEYPFGFSPGEWIPPACPDDTFCPDEGNGCVPLLRVGSACQLNRDDQCGPPKEWEVLADRQNFNGSLCLHSTCVYANATLGEQCIADQTTYIDIGPSGEEFDFTVTRHNCLTPSLFCDPNTLRCIQTKAIGEDCSSDQDCHSLNCDSGSCVDPPEMPTQVKTWQWAAVISSVVTTMVLIVVTLIMIQKRIRARNYEEIHEYYEEQIRCGIMLSP
ncbi:hypothetical protein BXZ70DRAFT_902810 [Cristinia sonorae]|uniref:Uncharacterized protein n=1 Tax=Cristinia sonorae TaxID=1940300 RepID=A0A8K0XJK8_9AGAR|nr:hypothetical protein BXZ70DRAFT_902810 [Cristinia sonorae]